MLILLDDEFDIIAIFKQGLEKQGFHVFAFTGPLSALEHFQINSKQYVLVISDLRMPRMNGYEFIKKVKEMKPQVKVFFMTAFEIDGSRTNKRLITGLKSCGKEIPNILESFSQRHNTRVTCDGNLSLANLFAFL